MFPPASSCTSEAGKRRSGEAGGVSSGQGTAEQTEGTERERERGEEVLRSSSPSSASVPRNLSEPVYLGRGG